MQQKQQQNLLERKASLTNNLSPTSSNSSNKQRSHSFWNHFGIGGTTNKSEDSSDNVSNGSNVNNQTTTTIHDEAGYSLNVQNNDVTNHGMGMAPR